MAHIQSHLPVANVPTNTQHELLDHSVKEVSQGKEGQEAVVRAHLDVAQVHEALQGGHSCDQGMVGQHHTLGVACRPQ